MLLSDRTRYLVIPNHVDDCVAVPPGGQPLPERGHALMAGGSLALVLRRAGRKELGGGRSKTQHAKTTHATGR